MVPQGRDEEAQDAGGKTLEQEAGKARAKGTRCFSDVDANYDVSVGGNAGQLGGRDRDRAGRKTVSCGNRQS